MKKLKNHLGYILSFIKFRHNSVRVDATRFSQIFSHDETIKLVFKHDAAFYTSSSSSFLGGHTTSDVFRQFSRLLISGMAELLRTTLDLYLIYPAACYSREEQPAVDSVFAVQKRNQLPFCRKEKG